jgi:peroxiredoxin
VSRRRLVLVAATAVLAGCRAAAAPAPVSSPSRILGDELPSFRRATVQGGTFATAAAAGQVLVVDFFADYCRPCQRTLPALEALHRAHPEIAVVGVSLDDDAAGAERSIGRHHLTFPVVHDAGNVLAGRFRVTELPFAFVADRRGRIRFAAGPGQPDDAVPRAALAATTGS